MNSKEKKREEGRALMKNSYDQDELSFDEVFRLMLTLSAKENFRVYKETGPDFIRQLNSKGKKSQQCQYLYMFNNKIVLRELPEQTVFVFAKDSRENREKAEKKPSAYSFRKYNIESRGGFAFTLNEREAIKEALKINDRGEFYKEFAQIASKTRPDICTTIDMMANHSYLDDNREYQRRFCRYMKQTSGHSLHLNPHHSYHPQFDIIGYTDASIFPETSTKTKKDLAQLGYIVFLFGAPITWKSCKSDKVSTFKGDKKVGQSDDLERDAQEMMMDRIEKIRKLLKHLEVNFKKFTITQMNCLIRSDNTNKARKMDNRSEASSSGTKRHADPRPHSFHSREFNDTTYLPISGKTNQADNLTRELEFIPKKKIKLSNGPVTKVDNVGENNLEFCDRFIMKNADFLHFLKVFPGPDNQLGKPFADENNNMDIDNVNYDS